MVIPGSRRTARMAGTAARHGAPSMTIIVAKFSTVASRSEGGACSPAIRPDRRRRRHRRARCGSTTTASNWWGCADDPRRPGADRIARRRAQIEENLAGAEATILMKLGAGASSRRALRARRLVAQPALHRARLVGDRSAHAHLSSPKPGLVATGVVACGRPSDETNPVVAITSPELRYRASSRPARAGSRDVAGAVGLRRLCSQARPPIVVAPGTGGRLMLQEQVARTAGQNAWHIWRRSCSGRRCIRDAEGGPFGRCRACCGLGAACWIGKALLRRERAAALLRFRHEEVEEVCGNIRRTVAVSAQRRAREGCRCDASHVDSWHESRCGVRRRK